MTKNFAILRVSKLKSATAVRGMLRHNFRDIETPNADEDKLHENIHLSAETTAEGMEKYRAVLPEKVRKNAVHAIDYLITTSPDSTPQDNAEAIDEAIKWINEKHGKENVIMSSIHLDETTPHVHILAVPIDDQGKLNARSFIGGTKHRMSELQDEFYERIEKRGLELNRGVKGSKATHKDISTHYADVNAIKTKKSDIEKNGARKAGAMLSATVSKLDKTNLPSDDKGVVLNQLIDRVASEGLPDRGEPKPSKQRNEIDFD